jgi:hypothetical protein
MCQVSCHGPALHRCTRKFINEKNTVVSTLPGFPMIGGRTKIFFCEQILDVIIDCLSKLYDRSLLSPIHVESITLDVIACSNLTGLLISVCHHVKIWLAKLP